MAKNDVNELMSVGVNIGKYIFHLVGFDKEGQLVLFKKIKRIALMVTFEYLLRDIAGMKACMSAFCQPYAAQAGTRTSGHPNDLRSAVQQRTEERLQ